MTITVELTDEEAWQLAEFCKRLTWDDCRKRATSDEDTHTMIAALSRVAEALREKGYAPR